MKLKKQKYENFCLQCGKKFNTNKKNVKVCSPECAIARKRGKDKRYWKNYYENNKEKILIKNRQWWKDNKGPPKERKVKKRVLYEKECVICEVKFNTTNEAIKHCILHRYRRRPTNVFPCTCIYCGDEFWSKKKTDEVCLNPKCIKKSQKQSVSI